jgi:hypothetical protein
MWMPLIMQRVSVSNDPIAAADAVDAAGLIARAAALSLFGDRTTAPPDTEHTHRKL